MSLLLEGLARRGLVVVTGKGGVGKTVVAAALAAVLAGRGRRIRVLETDPRESLHRLFDLPPSGGRPVAAGERVVVQNLDPRRVVDRLVAQRLRIRALARRVLASPVYRTFVEAAPGIREAAVLGRSLRLLRGRDLEGAPRPDTVVLDAPATGHGVALLAAPRLLAEAVPGGPVGEMAREIAAFVADPERVAVVAVTVAEEMPVSETVELAAALERELGRGPEAVVANALLELAPDRRGAVPESPAARLAARRRALQERELERLASSVDAPTVRLPLLPLPPGPELLRALVRRLGEAA